MTIDKRGWRLHEWDAAQLERFCIVAYSAFRDGMSCRLDSYSNYDHYGPKNSDVVRREILNIALEEILKLQEKLIMMALGEGTLDRSKMSQSNVKTRKLFITEEG
mgnify:FL=1